MALTVKDILLLPGLERFNLAAGEKGLGNTVVSAGVADYEFSHGMRYTNDELFERDSFVITSLLFARDDSSAILPAVKRLKEYGVSGMAYKDVFFEKLPQEVIEYADSAGFPIFSFGPNVFFETIIYDIMSAVQADDNTYLTEENINRMISGAMSRTDMIDIARHLSLKFKQYVSVTCVMPAIAEDKLDVSRIYRNYYVSKTIKSKAIVAKYDRGLFIIVTSGKGDDEAHGLILNEVLDSLSIDREKVKIAVSSVLQSFSELDLAFRQSHYTAIAAQIRSVGCMSYPALGALKLLIPDAEEDHAVSFSEEYISRFDSNQEYYDTAVALVGQGGDITKTAQVMGCHTNTIRYRLSKIRELTGDTGLTEFEFYEDLSLAVTIRQIRQLQSQQN